jgi:site-specific DNA-cytosine methylase
MTTIKKNTFVELFCGSGTATKFFSSTNFETFSVDIRKRKGICEPDLRLDILDLTPGHIPFNDIDLLWIGLPCDIWSYASGGYHLDKEFNPKTQKCQVHLDIFHKTIQIIQDLKPRFFIIENPRGRLRHFPPFIQFLNQMNAKEFTVTLSSYGFPTTKPTNLFSNLDLSELLPCAPYGRGAKCAAHFDNLTKCQRQSTPFLLFEHIHSILYPNL